MATNGLKRELLDLESRYWRAIKEKDADTALNLTDDPCILSGAQGVALIDKDAFKRMLTAATWTLLEFEIKDDVAVLAYNVREKLTVDGKPVTVDAADASTWVRRGDRWVCALHTESIAGDPFGRDRVAPNR